MKKIKILAGALALCAIAGVNVWNAAEVFSSTELDIENIEMIAEGESDSFGIDDKNFEKFPVRCDFYYTKAYYGCAADPRGSFSVIYEGKYVSLNQVPSVHTTCGQTRPHSMYWWSVDGEKIECTPGESRCRERDCRPI